MTIKLYYDQFLEHQETGLNAYKSGDLQTARRHFLKAAQNLLRVAEKSEGRLREEHFANAEKLFDMARQMETGSGKISAGRGETEGGSDTQWRVIEKPDIRFDDIAGLDEIKQTILHRVINPFRFPEVTNRYRKKPGGGILLYGPPGTGKTMLAKAIATELDAPFYAVRCSDILSKWVGEAEQNMRSLFDAAGKCDRAVLFFDETEALLTRRGSHSTVMNRLVPEFLSLVDGIDTNRDAMTLLLGATNRPWDMDDAALREGRFGDVIYVGLPDAAARQKLIEMNLSDIPIAPDVDAQTIAELIRGYSGADIKGLLRKATDLPYEREIATGTPSALTMEDIRQSMKEFRVSVSEKMLDQFEKFRSQRR